YIRPAAAWFSTPEVGEAFGAVLSRPYDPERAGITEAAIERKAPLLVAGIEEWPGAPALKQRLYDQLPSEQAAHTWDWYVASSLLSVPVHAPDGRILGVLALSSGGFSDDDLRGAEVFANLAGIALDRSELLHREETRRREELLLNRAAQEMGRSLELDAVYRAIVEQARAVSGLGKVLLLRQEPASRDLDVVAATGVSERMRAQRFAVGEGMIGRVAETGEPYVSREADRERFLPWVIAEEGIQSFAHVPLSIGPRLFGVLTVADERPHKCDDALLGRMIAFGRAAAGAIANALDFQRERRVALALTRGFIPGPLAELEGFDAGLVYEPTGRAAGGGDLFGLWRLSSGAVAFVVGDVSGKGIEVAAISAMVRFFIEARTWDAADPAAVMDQTNALLRRRLPGTTFVPVVMAVIDERRVRWCNAGHTPPILLAADGSRRELSGTGLPLGVDPDATYTSAEAPLGAGDLVFACTDGLTEARREGRQFGDERLDALLAEHGRTLDPGDLVHLLQREAEAWAPNIDDDMVILAVRRRG
ncbi:MAG TPA: SpoIIE family protein phosphatase, partial [Solirubrobacteraceae bacterium]|nr:SpoIIE family protein phosphatase [Solirubrobacteraceae bacterium]